MTAPHQNTITLEQYLKWRTALREEKTARVKPVPSVRATVRFKMKLKARLGYDEIVYAIDERIKELKERNK